MVTIISKSLGERYVEQARTAESAIGIAAFHSFCQALIEEPFSEEGDAKWQAEQRIIDALMEAATSRDLFDDSKNIIVDVSEIDMGGIN